MDVLRVMKINTVVKVKVNKYRDLVQFPVFFLEENFQESEHRLMNK